MRYSRRRGYGRRSVRSTRRGYGRRGSIRRRSSTRVRRIGYRM